MRKVEREECEVRVTVIVWRAAGESGVLERDYLKKISERMSEIEYEWELKERRTWKEGSYHSDKRRGRDKRGTNT